MSDQKKQQQAASMPFQPGTPVPVGYVLRGHANGFHVCISAHVTGQNPPPPYQSNDNWRWVSL